MDFADGLPEEDEEEDIDYDDDDDEVNCEGKLPCSILNAAFEGGPFQTRHSRWLHPYKL